MVANLVVFEVRKRTDRDWACRDQANGEHGWIGDDFVAKFATYGEASEYVAKMPPRKVDSTTGLSVEYYVFKRQLIGSDVIEAYGLPNVKPDDDMPRNVKFVFPS